MASYPQPCARSPFEVTKPILGTTVCPPPLLPPEVAPDAKSPSLFSAPKQHRDITKKDRDKTETRRRHDRDMTETSPRQDRGILGEFFPVHARRPAALSMQDPKLIAIGEQNVDSVLETAWLYLSIVFGIILLHNISQIFIVVKALLR